MPLIVNISFGTSHPWVRSSSTINLNGTAGEAGRSILVPVTPSIFEGPSFLKHEL